MEDIARHEQVDTPGSSPTRFRIRVVASFPLLPLARPSQRRIDGGLVGGRGGEWEIATPDKPLFRERPSDEVTRKAGVNAHRVAPAVSEKRFF